jgi:predicted deacylase
MKTLPPFRTGERRVERGHVQPIEGIDIPFCIIEGAEAGPCVLVTAGVHGSEYCSIETAVRLTKLEPEAIRGTLVVLPILNVEAFRRRAIYVMPQDGRNLNRMFPGRPDGSLSERLANWLTTEVYPHADAYLDLHGGDLDEALMPFTIYPHDCEKSKAMAAAFGIPVCIASQSSGHTIRAARNAGVPSILPEVSGNGLWGEETVGMMMDGVRRVLAHVGLLDGKAAPATAQKPEFVSMWVPAAPVDGLWYSAREVGDAVAAGDLLGEIRDVFGAVLACVRSEKSGIVVYRLTSLAVNAGEALLGVGSPLPA